MAKLTGTNPGQVPTNADLGTMAYQDKDNVNINGGGINLKDNNKIQLGDSSDLQIYHDGSHSYISDQGTGQLKLLAQNFQLMNAAGTSDIIVGIASGTVELKYNGATKLATTSTGIDVTGEVKVSSGLLELDGNGIGGTQVTIADDAVASITPPRKGGFMFVTAGLTGGNYPQQSRSGMVFFDAGDSLEIQERITASELDVSTSDVTGTTGTDGNVTIAVQSGVLKIENRGGSTHVFDVTFL